MSGFATSLFSGERFAVVGLGRNGLPAARALRAMGAEVILWDDQEAARDIAIAQDFPVGDPRETIGEMTALVLSPGIPHLLPAPHPIAAAARLAGVPIVSDADLLFRAVRRANSAARFVGITGTNGKSTTTSLLAHILREADMKIAAGGNLGPAALALPLLPNDGVYVLEMSSYMLERIADIRLDAAAMLNLSPDHLDRHGDMTGYTAAKMAVFARQTARDTAVIGVDDSYSRDLVSRVGPARRVTISGDSPADIFCKDNILRDVSGAIVDMREAKALPGAHNAQNAAAATALALALGVGRDNVARGIISFPGLAHRQQLVAEIDGIRYINDSKATNADAASRALACYDRIIWIAGGVAKAGGIESLVPLFPRVRHALLIGRDAPDLAVTLRDQGVSFDIVGTLEQAVPAARAAAARLDAPVVLLSPACASFDQFTGFDQRGDRFAQLVLQMTVGNAG